MTMISPGRAGIALEDARLDGDEERPDTFTGAFVVAFLPVTFFAVLVSAEALLPVVFLLLAVVFFPGTFASLPLALCPPYFFDFTEGHRRIAAWVGPVGGRSSVASHEAVLEARGFVGALFMRSGTASLRCFR
jgi:hypothetical protein